MLSRRDMLLVQPWADRRYKDHRSKVAAAAPAVDARAPAPRAHVALKLKLWQRERERAAAVQRRNMGLLQRLAAAGRAPRPRPPPRARSFHNKVGRFFDETTLRERVQARRDREPRRALRLPAVKCYACHYKKMQHDGLGAAAAPGRSRPSVQ